MRKDIPPMLKGVEITMATTTVGTENSTMVAVFADRDQANRAIDDLRHANYGYDSIRLVQRGSSSFMDNLKSLFSQVSATTNSADDWMRVGVPEQDAHRYQSELDAGRSIVLIKALDNPEQALGIMRQSGAYDIAMRLRMEQPPMATGAYNPNARQGTYNPNAQPGTYNPNAQPVNNNPDIAPVDGNPNKIPPHA
jgi:hypothetical protein